MVRVNVLDYRARGVWTAKSRSSQKRASNQPKQACFGGKMAVELMDLTLAIIWLSSKVGTDLVFEHDSESPAEAEPRGGGCFLWSVKPFRPNGEKL